MPGVCLALRAALFSALLPVCAFAADPVPPVMRLGDDVRPLAYRLETTLVPEAPRFEGRVEIDVDLRRPLSFFWINGASLDVRDATLVARGRKFKARAVAGGDQFIGLRFAKAVPAGRARLSIAYGGSFSLRETRGLFVQKDAAGNAYAYTQFEAVDARRAFPSFDEPHWKTPWTVTLNVRADHVAVANYPQVAEKPLPGGMKQVRFATTPALPTYLVAFAAGPFDIVDGGTAGVNRTQLRYITPKGLGAQARYAKEVTPRLLELLENYFGRPYPFAKLDSLAIPITIAFGAMENPGLITYNSGLLLAPLSREHDRFKQFYAGTGAHEIAHQWFGNLVTMDWWEDVWLNESFATWMARKVVRKFNPEWDGDAWSERERQQATMTDRLSSTRQVRQPVRTRDDLGNAFDRISYDKGGAILTTFETWLGEDAFREGVRRYLKKHEWGNASAEDFFAALAQADPVVAQAFSSFVTQPGVPIVDFLLDCSRRPAAVQLRQQRFEPLAPAGKAPQKWMVPVCVRYAGQAAGEKPVCTLMREQQERIELPAAGACPAWILPNPGSMGYYLARVEGGQGAALPAAQLTEREAASYINDQALLVRSGALPWRQLLAAVEPFAADARPQVVAAAANAIAKLHPGLFDGGREQAVGRWVREQFGARATQLGWVLRPMDNDKTKRLRGVLVRLVADVGGDEQLRAQARSLTLAWIAGDRAPLGGTYRDVLHTAAAFGDGALFDALVAAVPKAADVATRYDIFDALGNFRDPALRQRAFEFALAEGHDLRESARLLEAAGEEPANAAALLAFVRERYDTLGRGLPEETVARMPSWHNELCSVEDRRALAALYEPRLPGPPGFERNLAQALEAVDICILARGTGARLAGDSPPQQRQ